MSDGERTVQIAVCERHGLRYNAAVESGCARCRREGAAGAGAPATATAAAPAPAAAAPSPAASPAVARTAGASLPLQLVVALLLVLATGALFRGARDTVIETFPLLRTLAGRQTLLPGSGLAPDGASTPATAAQAGLAGAASPAPSGVAIGPAEEQRQMNELMRQLREDARKERAGAAEPPP